MCGNIACAVNTLDDAEDIPPVWRVEELSKLQGPKAEHPGRQQQKERGKDPLQGNLGENVDESCVVEYDDECDERDYCVPEDESVSAKGDYVSLLDNPERFTGYSGESAHMVWDAIYRENCFSKPQAENKTSNATASGPLQAAKDLRSVMQSNTNYSALLDDTCLEKRVFHRIISGMHASISTHICYDYLDQKTGKWKPNLACYQSRLADHPDRVSNIYFNFALVLRAIAKLQLHLQSYTFCSGDVAQNRETKAKVMALARNAAVSPPIFDETLMFQDPSSAGLELKEDFRNRFRNVSRLMDCVGCDKCRLWGKLQTAGYGTALKVLFEYDEADSGDFYVKRTELVALVNTLDRIGSSISALAHFRAMLEPAETVETEERDHSSAGSEDFASRSQSAGDDLSDEVSNNTTPPYDTSAIAYAELDLIYRTTLHVLREWAGLPRKLGRMATWELSRLWAFWLGLPTPQIAYEWVWNHAKAGGDGPARRLERDEL